ncbi:uncharacterized protein LOC143196181 isoform X2 [Rhynchophorus ferrugineus]|uniref:uncharacterized protein LOC143196181 isoform X2 n=1 Tax=Rhynchophorus ferrugineus TaxID=354439 RepID=UPI003FCD5EEF
MSRCLLISVFILLVAASTEVESFGSSCPSTEYICVNETHYQDCWYFFFFAQFGSEESCPEGQICNEETDGDKCITVTTTTLAPTTTTKRTCPSKSFICKNETAYQICRWIFFVDFYDEAVQCEDGYICDTSSNATEQCIEQVTTVAPTTVAPSTDKPFYCWILFFLC